MKVYSQLKLPIGKLSLSDSWPILTEMIGAERLPCLCCEVDGTNQVGHPTMREDRLYDAIKNSTSPAGTRFLLDLETEPWSVVRGGAVNNIAVHERIRIIKECRNIRPDLRYGYFGELPGPLDLRLMNGQGEPNDLTALRQKQLKVYNDPLVRKLAGTVDFLMPYIYPGVLYDQGGKTIPWPIWYTCKIIHWTIQLATTVFQGKEIIPIFSIRFYEDMEAAGNRFFPTNYLAEILNKVDSLQLESVAFWNVNKHDGPWNASMPWWRELMRWRLKDA